MPGRHSRTLSIDPLPPGTSDGSEHAWRNAAATTDQGGPGGQAQGAGVDNRGSGVWPSLIPTSRGGYTRAQLEALGVPWPPPKGWKKQLEAAAGAAGEPALENTLDISSGWGSKWAVLDELRKFTTIPGQRSCMAITRSPNVTVGRRDGAAIFGQALPCGKRFCPNCGPRIQAARRDDLRETVAAARARGWGVYFLTLTLGHSPADTLADLLDALDSSLRAMLRGGFWNRLRRRHGIKHYVRVTEEQQGGSNGWHPHFHLLLFVDPAEAREFSKFDLQDSLLDEWARVVDAAGYRASRTAQLLLEPTDEHLTRMAAYFSKQMAESLSWEMTGALLKRGKNGSLNPAQLLLAAVSGDTNARDAWRELEQATHRRRMIAWSVGIREDLRLPAIDPMGERIREEPPAPAEQLVCIPREAWQEHSFRAGFREELAVVVEGAEHASEVLWWLESRGITASSAPELPQRVSGPAEAGPPGMEWLASPLSPGGS